MFYINMALVQIKLNKKYKTLTNLFKIYIFGICTHSYISVCRFINSRQMEHIQNQGWKHEVIENDVFSYNVVWPIRFGNLNLKPNLPTHQTQKRKKESAPKKFKFMSACVEVACAC